MTRQFVPEHAGLVNVCWSPHWRWRTDKAKYRTNFALTQRTTPYTAVARSSRGALGYCGVNGCCLASVTLDR